MTDNRLGPAHSREEHLRAAQAEAAAAAVRSVELLARRAARKAQAEAAQKD